MVQIVNIDIKEFVEKYYEMNPELEDLLPNGMLLKPGMVVLIGDFDKREDVHDRMHPRLLAGARQNNRWCTVSEVSIRGNTVSFIGTYFDGAKVKRTENLEVSWIVRTDSVPDHENFKIVREMVWEAMQFALPADGVADEVAREICQLFDK